MKIEQEKLIATMTEEIASGRIKIGDEADPIEIIKARYPLMLGRIIWDCVPGAVRTSVPFSSRFSIENLPPIENFLVNFAAAASLSPESEVILVGDGITDIAITIPFELLKLHLPSILEIPQAIYVVTTDGEWCFNYTFENELYFGRACLS